MKLSFFPFFQCLINFLDNIKAEAALVQSNGDVSINEEEARPIFELRRFSTRTELKTKKLLQAAVSNGKLVMALNNNHIIRFDIAEQDVFEDIALAKPEEPHAIHKIFLDPTGNHMLINMGTEDNLYLHSSMKKPKTIPKLKGMVIESVAWDLQNIDSHTTQTILLGTHTGKIFETCIVDSAKDVITVLKPVSLLVKLVLTCKVIYYRCKPPSASKRTPLGKIYCNRKIKVFRYSHNYI